MKKHHISVKIFFQIPLLAVLIFSHPVISQDQLNEDFLKSLPEDVRTDYLREMSEANEVKDEVYNAPKTSVDTLESNLQKIQIQLMQIERSLDSKRDSGGLKRFGPDFFNTTQSTFMPINEPNFASDYVVDRGDTLKIQMIGQQSEAISAIIQQDGSINIPKVAAIYVAGLSLKDAGEVIQANLAEAFIGATSFTTLTNMRNINVLVIGNTQSPGVYTFNGGSNVLSVLNASGGISDQGSFRSVHIKRNNKIIDEIDLYEVLINGNLKFSHGLRSGDAVIVQSKGPEISISGGVNNPGIYELKKSGDTAATMIEFAGGLIPGNISKVILERKNSGKKDTMLINLNELENFNLINGDDLKIPSYSSASNPIHSVELTGEVVLPGKYTISDGEKLTSVVERAGGYTNNAYAFGGVLTRETAKEIERVVNERIYQDMIKFIATDANAKGIVAGGGNTLPLILNEFKNVQPVGRVTAEFDLTKLKQNNLLDTKLQDGDRVHIPAFSQEIYVLGEVITPGARLYDPSARAKDYINKSGGLGIYGDKKRVVIIAPNGDSYLWEDSLFSFKQSEFDIIPGTVIYVPREIGKINGLNYASAIAPIFSSLALSIASLNSINN
jgi:protein involved in polysaccharide export with SLBB domain